MGESDAPVSTPVGARAGVSNGERTLTAEVGAPGTLDGSALGVAFCEPTGAGSLPSSAPPAVSAAPVSRSRRVIFSRFIAGERPSHFVVLRRLRRQGWRDVITVAVGTPRVLWSRRERHGEHRRQANPAVCQVSPAAAAM